MPPLKLGELLQQKGLLKDSQFKIALAEQAITGERLGATIIGLGFVSSSNIAQCLAEQAGIPFLDITGYNIPEKVLRVVSRDMAQNMGFLPINIEDDLLTIGITNAGNLRAIDHAANIGNKPPKVYLVDSDLFQETLEKAYYFLDNPILQGIERLINIFKNEALPAGPNIASLCDYLIQDSIRRNASDIHFTPTAKTLHVNYRIDGVLYQGHCLPKNLIVGIVSRIKVLSKLDIAEQRIPQDGIFSFAFLKRAYEMRVSTLPTINGEDIVIKIIGSSSSLLRTRNLGFDEEDVNIIKNIFSKPSGMILIVGPTGAGKTTTLFAALRDIDLIEKSVITVEDPVESRLSMIKQTGVSDKVGYTFSIAGKSFMRHDPDVILVGEITDEENARVVMGASVTGHLVLSTLHTKDAASAIPRLVNFNIERFAIASSLVAIVGQRLVRKICLNCKEEHIFEPGELTSMGFSDLEGNVRKTYKGRGCPVCNGTGYIGRTAIGEILVVDDDIRELISSSASISAFRDAAVGKGMKTIRQNGIKKALEGITTLEEVLRVTG